MTTHHTSILALALPLMALGCELTPPEMGFLPEDHAAIEGISEEYADAFIAGDWEGVARLFHPDGVLMPPDESAVTGRIAIAAALEPDPGVEYLSFTVETDEVEGGTWMAFSRGSYTLQFEVTTPDGVQVLQDEGSWLAILRRDGDEPWAIHRQIWNSNLPPVPAG